MDATASNSDWMTLRRNETQTPALARAVREALRSPSRSGALHPMSGSGCSSTIAACADHPGRRQLNAVGVLNLKAVPMMAMFMINRPSGVYFAGAAVALVSVKREAFQRLAEEYQAMARRLEELIASGDLPGDLGI
jgi:hypothetical protein